MAELKTKVNDQSVTAFLNGIADEQRRQDCFTVLELMRQATKAEPKMWGSAIVGFGDNHYIYASGREGDWFLTGFSSRKQNLTLYLSGGFEQQAPLMQKLGKHKVGRGCLYINNLEDIHLPTLKTLIAKSVKQAVTHNRAALAASKTAKQKKG
jgi:Domain of unknown function (DU1801)